MSTFRVTLEWGLSVLLSTSKHCREGGGNVCALEELLNSSELVS